MTTQLGDEAGAPSVPNVLTRVESWADVVAAADGAGLGGDLVLQTPYGDSGKTTFFVAAEADWDRHADDIVGQDVKIMKRITNRPVAVEAVLTRHGTIVGPFMSELTGFAELTPYRGGWCGNEMFPEVLTGDRRAKATDLVRRLGDRLGQEGYRGFFEVDVLVDLDSDAVYLGELNPRISGASAITNVTAGAYADVPLFLFHLLEFMGVDFELDVDEVNERWAELASSDLWSQMIIKEIAPRRRADRRRAADRAVRRRPDRRAGLPADGPGLAPAAGRVGVLLPAGLRRGRLPVEGRRPGRAGHQGPAADRGPGGQRAERADHPGQAPHRLGAGGLRGHADRRARRRPGPRDAIRPRHGLKSGATRPAGTQAQPGSSEHDVSNHPRGCRSRPTTGRPRPIWAGHSSTSPTSSRPR